MKKLITAILSLIFVLSMYVPAVAVSHVESNSDIYASQDYLYDTLTIAGSGFESVQTFTLYDIETLASDQKLGLGYTNRYSTMTSGSVFSVHEYSGIRLYDFLVWCGLDESLPDSTQVKTVAKDGYDIRFTLGDLRSETYSRYSYKGDDKADETALPIIVAFASDGVPLVGPTGSQSVLKKFTAAEGYDESADNVGGPLRLIVGQKSSYDFNAHDCSKWLAAIVVGDDNGYVYDRVDTTQTDLSEPEPGGDWTHGEDYSDFTLKIHGTQANGVSYVSLSQIESMTDGMDRGYYAASAGKNAYEGVTLKYLLEQYMDDDLTQPDKITVVAADGYSKTLDVSVVWNGIVSHYQPGKTKNVLLAYAIDGAPLVEGADSAGYNGSNAYGPLRLVVENTISSWVKNVTEIIIGEDDTFDDMSGYRWAENAAAQLKKLGIVDGTGNNMYSPSKNIRRGDFTLILDRVFDFHNAFDVGFDDVAQDSYWYDAILSAKSAGIVNGYGESFMPYSSIKRQDAAVMVYRALMSEGKIEDVSFDLSEYNDAQSISSYASEAVATLSAMGILNGSNGSFRPNDAITRAEAAVLIYRVMNL